MPEPVALFFALAIIYFLLIVEAVLALGAVRMAPKRWRLERLERVLARLAARPALSLAVVAGVALIGRLLLLPLLPIRAPQVTDEFSYLLQADTFASGRLANPTHPMWRHLETIHVMHQPAYASMHQPLQGLFLAAGKVVAGHPWAGVWASVGLMCAAVCWALRGWFPPRWALLGGLLVALRLGLFSYWMNSYWGGAPAAIGGALVLGALGRLRFRASVRHSLLMGLGMAVLALSRPYEGFVVCLPVAVWLVAKRPRALVPVGLVAALGVGFLGYYFYRLTGSPLRPPELVQREPYAVAGVFFWESPRPEPAYRHKPLRDFYAGWELKSFTEVGTLRGFLWNRTRNLISFWLLYLGPVLTLPLIFLGRVVGDRRVRLLVMVGAVALVGLNLNVWFYAHYAAPVTALVFALVIQSLRHLRAWRRRTGAGVFLARAVPAICVVMIAVRLLATPVKLIFPPDWPMTWYWNSPGNVKRARVLDQLTQTEGLHLVMVRYSDKHEAVMNEWVYNQADIDRAKVVWAREMDGASNRELLRYFSNRRVWLVEPDRDPPVPKPVLR